MLLKSKDGISCDLCGEISKESFVYYSLEGPKVRVSGNFTQQLGHAMELDACENCFQDWAACRHEAKPNSIVCDLCGKVLTGTFEYIFLEAIKVDVDKKKADDKGHLRPDVERKVMDFKLDVRCQGDLVDKIFAVRRKVRDSKEST